MKAAALLVLVLAPVAPAAEILIDFPADICPVEPADRWGWRSEVLHEAPGHWRVRIWAAGPLLPDPPSLTPLRQAVAEVQARLTYDAGIWTENPAEALRSGRGNCVSYAAVLEADLARQGYQTRRVHGLLFDPGGEGNPHYLPQFQGTPHRWLEVLTMEHGWVPLDAVAPEGRLTARHLALRGNNSERWLRAARIEVIRWD